MRMAMMAITTSSSISVKPRRTMDMVLLATKAGSRNKQIGDTSLDVELGQLIRPRAYLDRPRPVHLARAFFLGVVRPVFVAWHEDEADLVGAGGRAVVGLV